MGIDTDDNLTGPIPAYLQNMADDLSQKMQLPDDINITVTVVKSDVINAFATLGGNIVFFTGLLKTLPNENTLAMVMAHEIAHIKLRHPLRALGRGVVVGLAVATLAGAGSNSIIDDFIGSTGLLTALRFTRDQEGAADELAVVALVGRYGHAGGSTQLFEILSKEHGGSNGKIPEFFSTHPLNQKRIVAIEAQAHQNHWPINGRAHAIPKSILDEIRHTPETLRDDELEGRKKSY